MVTEKMSEERKEKSDMSQVQLAEIDKETLCGIGSCTPTSVQCCARVGVFTASAGVASLFLQTLSTYISSQITSLEKQFGLRSTDSGLLVSCNDIGFLSTVLLASHFGRKGRIPRILAVSAIIYGIAGVVCSLSQFIEPASLPEVGGGSNQTSKSDSQYLCSTDGSGSSNITCADSQSAGSGSSSWVVIMLAISLVVQGICKSPRTSLSTVYIDNNVSDKQKTSLFLGIITTLTLFGPALAFTLGGAFSRIPVDLKATSLLPTDPRWIGAWWMGFLLFGAISIVTSFPLFCFPKRLPSSWMAPEEKSDLSLWQKIKGLPISVYRVLKSPVYTLTLVAITFTNFYVAGYVAFGPKYIENVFMIPAWKANIIQGIQAAIAIGCGTFFGGFLTSRFRLNPRGCLKFVVGVNCAALMLQSLNFIFGCNHPSIVGLDNTPQLQSSTGCECSDTSFLPVCGVETGTTYHSPCHAGCVALNGTIYSDCISEGGSDVTLGMCETGCPYLYAFIVNQVLQGLIGTLSIIPAYIVMLRSVEEEDKSMAIGILSFTISILSFLPAPIVFGRVLDTTCSLWNNECGVRGSCALYDIVDMRFKIIGFNVSLNAAATLVFFVAFLVRKYVVKYDKQDMTVTDTSDTKL